MTEVSGVVKGNAELVLGQEPVLGPGVRGYCVEVGDELYIPLVIADRPGNGDVGRYLDSLPRDRVVKFPMVLSPRLVGMLMRRGFRCEIEEADVTGEPVEVWARRPDLREQVDRLRGAVGIAVERLDFERLAKTFQEQMELPAPGTEFPPGDRRWTRYQIKEAEALWPAWFDREVQVVQVILRDALEGLKQG